MGAGGSTGKQGDLLETMADHEESINCMCVSEDGSMLVTGSEDATARMWATKTEETECIGVLKWVFRHGVSCYTESLLYVASCQGSQQLHQLRGGAGHLRDHGRGGLHHKEVGHDHLRVPLRVRGPHLQDTEVGLSSWHPTSDYVTLLFRILLTGDFIFSSSFDKTARAWLFDVSELGEGNEERACIKTFKV